MMNYQGVFGRLSALLVAYCIVKSENLYKSSLTSFPSFFHTFLCVMCLPNLYSVKQEHLCSVFCLLLIFPL